MTNPIEEADTQRRAYWKRFLIAFFISLLLLAVRALFYYAFAEHELNSKPIGIIVLLATIIALLFQVYFVVRLARLKQRAGANRQLKEAILEDELSKLQAIESWRPAFFGAVATPFFFLVISSIRPFYDLLTVALTTAIVGAGTYVTAYYLKSRA